MNRRSYLTELACPSCERIFSPDQIQTICPDCRSPLLANYDLNKVKNEVDRDIFKHRSKNMWRWFELLPVLNQENTITLGEGDTPLLPLSRLGKEVNSKNIFLKEEGINPTGSFKARGMASAISKAKELGIHKIVIPSAGNAGGALAAYAARAGIESIIYIPKSSPKSNISESQIMGSSISVVDGLIDLAGRYAEQKAVEEGYFNLSTFKEPYRVEGKKIMGYEIAESFGWNLPGVIIYPTGGGTGLVGIWKAFNELKTLGWLESGTLPRMIAVQAEGCAPVVKAIETNASACEVWDDAHTIATGLCVPKSFADKLMLKYIRESLGTAVSVSDGEITHWQQRIAQLEGIYCCPEGAATVAGLNKLLNLKVIQPYEIVVVFNTACGIKYLSA